MSLKSALSAAKKKYGITTPAAGKTAEVVAPTSISATPILDTSNPAASTQGAQQEENDTPVVASSSSSSVAATVVAEVPHPSPSTNAAPSSSIAVNAQPDTPLEVVATPTTVTTTKAPEKTSAAGVLLRPKRSRETMGGGGGEGPTRPKFGKDEVIAFMAKVKATQPKI